MTLRKLLSYPPRRVTFTFRSNIRFSLNPAARARIVTLPPSGVASYAAWMVGKYDGVGPSTFTGGTMLKFAVTLIGAFSVTVQLPVPLHAPPQPAKTELA